VQVSLLILFEMSPEAGEAEANFEATKISSRNVRGFQSATCVGTWYKSPQNEDWGTPIL